jgi:hypothetical protein
VQPNDYQIIFGFIVLELYWYSIACIVIIIGLLLYVSYYYYL